MARFTQEEALAFLRAGDVFYWNEYDPDEDDGERPPFRCLNMNDTWGWALAWGEYVPDDKLIEVAELFWQYGWAGCLYWVSEQHEQMRSEFHDVNRRVEFVRHEEEFKKRTPGSSKQAYTPYSYVLGLPSTSTPEST